MILQAQNTALLDTARVDVASIAHAGTGEDALGEGTEDSLRGAHDEEKTGLVLEGVIRIGACSVDGWDIR